MARWPLAFLLLLCTAAAAACDKDSSPESAPPSGSAETVTGRERLGWVQQASAGDIGALQFAAYVDGSRRVLEGVTCSPSSETAFECSAPLPPLGAGRHTIEMVTFFTSGSGVVESPRSPGLLVMVAGIVSRAPAAPGDGPPSAADGPELYAQLLADDLVDPTDVAVDRRQRAFVVERRGTLRIVDAAATAAGSGQAEPLFGQRDDGSEALSVALAPDFASSGLVYTLSAQASSTGVRLFVTRFRELHGRLGEAAVIVSHEVSGLGARDSGLGLPAGAPAAEAGARGSGPGSAALDGVLRFGPDGAMYIAAGGSEGGPGQILRLLPDGRVPADNPGRSPVYALVDLSPAGLDWRPADLSLWTVETGRAVDRFAVARRGGQSRGPANTAQIAGAAAMPLLPHNTRASGLTIVNAATSPFDGDAIVASIGLADLLRFAGSRTDAPAGEPVRLLAGRFGAIGGVTATPTGDIYFFTQNNEAWATGREVLVRLRPVP